MKGTRIKDIVTTFEQLFKDGAFGIANRMLGLAYRNVVLPSTDAHYMSNDKMIAYLKAARKHREQLPAYSHFLNSVRIELTKRGLNAEEMLKEFV